MKRMVPNEPFQKKTPRIRAPPKTVFPERHSWYQSNWARLERLREAAGQEGMRLTLKPEHEAALAAIRTHMLERRNITQNQINRLAAIYHRVFPKG